MYELIPIGRIRTPYETPGDCPRNVDWSGPVAVIEVGEAYRPGLEGLKAGDFIQVLYWLHGARRDRLRVERPHDGAGASKGVFARRSPHRPNPLASAVVRIEAVEEGAVTVRGMDCVDGTPLIDIKRAISLENEKGTFLF